MARAKSGYTLALADFVANLRYEDLPQHVKGAVTLHFLDAIGIALGAYATSHPLVKTLVTLGLEQKGKAEATIVGAGVKVSALEAAFINAVLTNFLDYSDGHFMGGHINDRLVPVALAVGEVTEASGREVITALAAGYEAYIDLAYTLFAQPESAELRLPYFVLLAPIAATLTAGKLFGLKREELAGAVGLAASYQLGASQYVITGGHEKDLSPGHEARRGLLATFLAERGVLGSPDVLEGDHGVAKAMGISSLSQPAVGSMWRIEECYFKPYPACRYLHASIEAALHLVQTYKFPPEEIAQVLILTNSSSARRVSYEIKSHVNAIFSHAYQVAAVLRYGRVDLPTTWAEKLRDPLFVSLMKKVKVQATPEYDELYQQKSLTQPPWPAEVHVFLRSREKYSAQVLSPKGDPINPLSLEELRTKFLNLAKTALTEHTANKLLENIERLEDIGNIKSLTALVQAK